MTAQVLIIGLHHGGRSVFTTRNFGKDEFLLIYMGELITEAEGNKHEKIKEIGFRFFFLMEGATLVGRQRRVCTLCGRSQRYLSTHLHRVHNVQGN